MAMDKFKGTWELDAKTVTGFLELMQALAVPAEKIEAYQRITNTTAVVDFEGENWTFSYTVESNPVSTVKFTLGQEYDGVSFDGSKYKGTITIDGDKLVEQQSSEVVGDKQYTVIRDVQGDELTVTAKFNEQTMTQIFRRKA